MREAFCDTGAAIASAIDQGAGMECTGEEREPTETDPILSLRRHSQHPLVEELHISQYWRFSSIMGFCDILIDVDKYFLYVYLIQTVGCEFEAPYGALALTYTMCYMAWSPVAGVVSDIIQSYAILTMIACSTAMVALYSAIILLQPRGSLLITIYCVRCTTQIQLSSTTWKTIKMYVEKELGSDPVLHEESMNKIGTLGDLATGVLEVGLVAFCMVSGVWFERYDLVSGVLSIGVLGIAISMMLLSWSLMLTYGATIPIKSAEVESGIQRRDSIVSVASTANNSYEAIRDIFSYFTTRWDYFVSSPLLTNCACLSMVSSCFEYMFDGPVTLTRATLSQTHHGLCNGAVDFILMQAFMLQAFYLAGGSLYFTFIMRMHPSTYYGKVFPAMSVMFMMATVSPFLPGPEILAAAVISVVTVVSYYMSIYNSYMLSGASRADCFGFVQGLYSIAVGIAGLVPSFLQLQQASQMMLMAVALVMAIWGLLQSLHLWKRVFAAPETHVQ